MTGDLAALLHEWSPRLQRHLVEDLALAPWFLLSLGVVLALERVIPAKASQRPFSAGVRVDVVWGLYDATLAFIVTGAFVVVLRTLYMRYLSFLSIEAVRDWPWIGRVLLALVLTDLVKWLTHVARHKVPLLWRFHAVHHSQRELNFFSDFRIHPFDELGHRLLHFVPVFMVDHSFATIVTVELVRQWHARLYHANLRTNFGPLRYVLVTPQSHRVHHSIEPHHRDRNFGAMLSIWDHLFGTQHRAYDDYPDTGIVDPTFPFEQHASGRGALERFAAQMVHPFRRAHMQSTRSPAVPSTTRRYFS